MSIKIKVLASTSLLKTQIDHRLPGTTNRGTKPTRIPHVTLFPLSLPTLPAKGQQKLWVNENHAVSPNSPLPTETHHFPLPDRQTRKLLATCSTVAFGGVCALLTPLLRSFPRGWLPAPTANPAAYEHEHGERDAKQPRNRRRNTRQTGGKGQEVGEGQGFARALRAVAAAALEVSTEYEQALWGQGNGGGYYPSTVALREYTCRSEGSEKGGMGPLPQFQRWGNVGVLCVSAGSAQVDVVFGDHEAGGRGLLQPAAWDWLKDFFQAPEMCLQVQILSSHPTIYRLLNPPLSTRTQRKTSY